MRLGSKATAKNDRIPRLGPGIDPTRLSLTPAEGFLLSRIDGVTPWSALRSFGGLAPEEVDRCLERWLKEGVVVVAARGGGGAAKTEGKTEKPAKPKAKPPAQSAPPPTQKSVAIDRSQLDASLEIPVDVQERILEFEGVLDRPYHEILGVPSDADRKALRRAYFTLSKELHPDRFFRRNVGPYGKRLDRIFGKIVEAYELLSDPTARAEIERSLAAAAGQPAPTAAAVESAGAEAERAPSESRPESAPKSLRAPRRPHVFSLHSRMLRERKARAKRLFEAGMAAHAAGRFTEAAGGVRLAIAFDPWNAIYKEHFVDVQRKAHEERAVKLMKEADAALELRDFAAALRAFEEVLGYRPHDAELLVRAARLAWATGGDLHQAKEWAMSAVEIDGQNAAAHRVLGQVYRAAGLEANARRALETALNLNPKDEEAQQELRAISGRPLGLRWLGGK
jgi:curved DNA-binding protein CbpA